MKAPIGFLIFMYFVMFIQSFLNIVIGVMNRDKFTSLFGVVGVSLCITVYLLIYKDKKL